VTRYRAARSVDAVARLARRWRIAVLVVVAGGAVLVADAGATGRGKRKPIPAPVQIQAVFDSAGNPSLIANSGGSTPSWTICSPAPGSACHPVPRTKHAILNPGPEPAGTAFVASVRLGGHTYTARVTWHGQVRSVAPPRVIGPTRFGAHVTVAAGAWTGGWGDEFDQLGLEACRTPSGTGCVVLSGGQYGCPGQPPNATVGGWLPGMYLFAFDLRVARDGACAGVGYAYPGAIRPWPVSQIATRSSPSGPVTGPPRPTVSILRRARLHAGRVLVAAVQCSTVCHVWLDAFGAASGSSGRTTVTGSATVGVPRRQLVPGRLRVDLHIDDGPQISGNLRLLP
jgi:hypothetical protein